MTRSSKRSCSLVLSLVIILSLTFNGIAYSAVKSLNVVANPVVVKINGKVVKIDVFNYMNNLYIQPQDICSVLGRGYKYNSGSKIINVGSGKTVGMANKKFAAEKPNSKIKINASINAGTLIADNVSKTTDFLGYNGAVFVRVGILCNLLKEKCSLSGKSLLIVDSKPATPVLKVDKDSPTNGDVSVTISGWGNASVKEYKLDNGGWQKYDAPLVITSNATIYARGMALSKRYSDIASLVISNIDKTPPTKPNITPSITNPTNNDVIITIDNWGDASINECKIDEGDWQTYTTPIAISVNSSISARGTDAVGNVSEISSITVNNIDKTPPAKPNLTPSTQNPTKDDVLISIDNWGDAAVKEYKIGEGAWQAYTSPAAISVNTSVSARGTDAVGNASETSSITINNIDKTPPTKPSLTLTSTNPTKDSVMVIADNWGDAAVKEYRIDNGPWQPYGGPITVNSNCYVYARGTDSVGNISEEANVVVSNIDKTPPSKPNLTPSATSKVKDSLTVTIDNWGDAAAKEYKIDNGGWIQYNGPVVMNANGTIYARGTDSVGNVSEEGSLEINNIVTKLNSADISKQQNDAIVKIYVYNANGWLMATGSGFIVSPDGKVVTNYHVIDMASKIEVATSDGKKYTVDGILDYSVQKDLAVLKLNNAGSLQAVELGNSDELNIGDNVVAIGSPLGVQNTLSNGYVSNIQKNLGRKDYTDLLITAPISPGSSGGPLFNMYGEVVGVTYASLRSGQNMNFAIPVNDVKSMIDANQTKSIAVVKKEVNGAMTYSDFADFLYDAYSDYTIGDYTFNCQEVDVIDSQSNSNSIICGLILNADDYLVVLNAIRDGRKKDVETWVTHVTNEIAAQYGGKKVSVLLAFDGTFSSYPNSFASDEITYSNGSYSVFHIIIMGAYSYEDGKLEFTWGE